MQDQFGVNVESTWGSPAPPHPVPTGVVDSRVVVVVAVAVSKGRAAHAGDPAAASSVKQLTSSAAEKEEDIELQRCRGAQERAR